MANDLALPATGMDDAFKAFAAQQGGVDSLSEGITGSYGVLGYRGKVWSLRYKGEKYNFVRQDDGTPAAAIDVIILRSAKQKSKSFYDSFDEHQSEGKRPICASLDGILPDEDVVQKQSETCALADVIAICEEHGWDWSYHAFREWQGWSVEHGPDPANTQPVAEPTDRQKLLREWFGKNQKPAWTPSPAGR